MQALQTETRRRQRKLVGRSRALENLNIATSIFAFLLKDGYQYSFSGIRYLRFRVLWHFKDFYCWIRTSRSVMGLGIVAARFVSEELRLCDIAP
jgi:hypothetical protein